jgi:heptose I phosphotransferase
LRRYRQRPLRRIFAEEGAFWQRVDARARKLYFKFHKRWPATPFDRHD